MMSIDLRHLRVFQFCENQDVIRFLEIDSFIHIIIIKTMELYEFCMGTDVIETNQINNLRRKILTNIL
jgi:hypothetical protein